MQWHTLAMKDVLLLLGIIFFEGISSDLKIYSNSRICSIWRQNIFPSILAPILLNQQSLLTNYVIYSIIALWFNLVFDTTEILLKAQLSSIVRIMVNLAFIYGIIAVLSYKAHKLEKEIETLTFKTREQSQKIVSLSQTIKKFRAGFETFKSAVANQIQDYEVKLYYKNGLIKIFMHDRNKRILRFRILEELYMRKQNIESPVIEKLKSFDGLNALYKKSQNQCTQLKEKVQN